MLGKRSPEQREKLRILDAELAVLMAKRKLLDEEIIAVTRKIRDAQRVGAFF